MPNAEEIYENLLRRGFTKDEIHSAIHKYFLLCAKEKNTGTLTRPHFQFRKIFNFINRLKGKALCLLKTQFAKKPKNPV